jgi:DNA-binding MarR family transcriptional regulator
MVDADLVITLPDPSDKRSIRLEFSPNTEKIRAASRIALSSLEELLARRIGMHTVDDLWRALDVDWGNYIETKSELDEMLNRKPRRK